MADALDKKVKKKKSVDEGKKKMSLKKEIVKEAEEVAPPAPPTEEDLFLPERVTDELESEGQEESIDSEQIGEEEEPPNPRRKPSNLVVEVDIDTLNELRAAFDIFDFNHDGVIDKEDLRNAMIATGENILDIDEEELDEMIFEGYEPFDFESFAFLIHRRTADLEPVAVVKEALAHWDPEDTGLIPIQKFRYDMTHLGEPLSIDEIDEALEEAPIKKEFIDEKVTRMIKYAKFSKLLGKN